MLPSVFLDASRKSTYVMERTIVMMDPMKVQSIVRRLIALRCNFVVRIIVVSLKGGNAILTTTVAIIAMKRAVLRRSVIQKWSSGIRYWFQFITPFIQIPKMILEEQFVLLSEVTGPILIAVLLY